MARYNSILKGLIDLDKPVSAAEIAAKLNCKVNQINTQLHRMVDRGWLNIDDEKKYSVTDKGKEDSTSNLTGILPISRADEEDTFINAILEVVLATTRMQLAVINLVMKSNTQRR